MSAYIVENNTIDRILSAINSNRDIGDWIKRTIKRETGDDLDTAEGLTLFGRKLLDMNENAVNQRYKGDDNVGVFVDYRFRLVLNSAVDGFKALACLMYQCSEGDVPNSDFYKLMDKIKGAMAEEIEAIAESDEDGDESDDEISEATNELIVSQLELIAEAAAALAVVFKGAK